MRTFKTFLYIPLFILGWLLPIPYYILGKVSAYFVVPFAIYKYRNDPPETIWLGLLWFWDSKRDDAGNYADHWYYKPANKTGRLHWAWRFGSKFAEFYWRTRNGFSNGMRYPVFMKGTKNPGTIYRPAWHHYGFRKGPKRWAYGARVANNIPQGEELSALSNWLFCFEYDTKRPWVSRLTITYLVSETSNRYFYFYVGYKLDRKYPEFGYSLRPFFFWPMRNEDYA